MVGIPDSNNITIRNQSGIQQNYLLFGEKPGVTNMTPDRIWPSYIKHMRAPHDSNTHFSIGKQYHAICAASDGLPVDGVTATVASTRPVTLGVQNADGSTTPGTSLSLTVQDEALQFDDGNKPPGQGGQVGGFEMSTDASLTVPEALERHWLVGVGFEAHNGDAIPIALIHPEPNTIYQFTPSSIYYIVAGDAQEGTLVDVSTLGNTVAIDFSRLGNQVTIIHDAQGNFTVQPAEL